jgi:flagellar motor switch protein FliM
MSDLLTPDEIAALTAAFAADAPPSPRASAPGVRTVDLTNQERSLEGRLPALELVLGRFARGLRGVIAGFFGDVPAVMPKTLGLVRFERLAARLAEPAGLVRFRMTPLRGHGILTVPSSLVAALLQVSCGGPAGQASTLPSREFSAVELRLIERLAARLLVELRAAWEPVAGLDLALTRVETTPLFATIAAPDELVVHAELAVVVSGLAPSTISLVLPNASLDPIRTRLQTVRAVDESGTTAADAGWSARLRDRLLDVPIEVAVELGGSAMAVSRLLELAVGDLLQLEVGRDGPVVVRVAGEPHFHGAPGVQNGNNAVRVTTRL